VVDAFCAKDAVPFIEPAYEAAMRREVAKTVAEIPHRDLCIQWDLCVEMILWDGRSTFYSPVADKRGIQERVNRLCRDIPGEVELGFHHVTATSRPSTSSSRSTPPVWFRSQTSWSGTLAARFRSFTAGADRAQ
jgi:hypothetical protein